MIKLTLTVMLLLSASLPVNAADLQARLPADRYLVKPAYPASAFARGIEGFVKLSYDVGRDGRVSHIRIIQSVPPQVFDREAVYALSRWQLEKDKPAKDRTVTMKFKLDGSQ